MSLNIQHIPVRDLNSTQEHAYFSQQVMQRSIMNLYDDIDTMNCLIGILQTNNQRLEYNIPIHRASHLITSLYISAGIIYADMVLLDTKTGKQLQKLYKHNQTNFKLIGIADITPEHIVTHYQILTVIALPKGTHNE